MNPIQHTIRNRIKSHRRVRAADLVPNEWNFRAHPEHQRNALADLYQQIGFSRSLLAFELPDGRLKLIDGHLRRDLTPDMEVDVEILDVTEEEARALLLSIDPLAALAETQRQLHDRLLEITPADTPELQAAWQTAVLNAVENCKPPSENKRPLTTIPEQWLILITCQNELHQLELLARFQQENLQCKPLCS